MEAASGVGIGCKPILPDALCWTCYAPGVRHRCGRCKLVRFCDQACLQQGWPRHKHVCAQAGLAGPATLPYERLRSLQDLLHLCSTNQVQLSWCKEVGRDLVVTQDQLQGNIVMRGSSWACTREALQGANAEEGLPHGADNICTFLGTIHTVKPSGKDTLQALRAYARRVQPMWFVPLSSDTGFVPCITWYEGAPSRSVDSLGLAVCSVPLALVAHACDPNVGVRVMLMAPPPADDFLREPLVYSVFNTHTYVHRDVLDLLCRQSWVKVCYEVVALKALPRGTSLRVSLTGIMDAKWCPRVLRRMEHEWKDLGRCLTSQKSLVCSCTGFLPEDTAGLWRASGLLDLPLTELAALYTSVLEPEERAALVCVQLAKVVERVPLHPRAKVPCFQADIVRALRPFEVLIRRLLAGNKLQQAAEHGAP